MNKNFYKLTAALLIGAFALSSCQTIEVVNPEPITNKPKTISGSVVDNRARRVSVTSKTIIRIQDTTPTPATFASLDFDLNLEGVSVLAVTASGEVLTSSLIDAQTGAFNLSVAPEKTVALVLATKGASGKWLCQQPLEFFGSGALKTAAFKVSADTSLGEFAFNSASGRAVADALSTVTVSSDAAFADDSLSGYQRCGNENALDSTVSMNYDLSAVDAAAFVADDPRYYESALSFAVDGTGRWVGSAPFAKPSPNDLLSVSGSSQIRVRLEAGASRNVTPVLFDTKTSGEKELRTPTWNLDQTPRALSTAKPADFGNLKGALVLLSGVTQSDKDAPLAGVQVSVDLSGDLTPAREASNGARSGGDGSYQMLVPKPGDTGTWLLRARNDDGSVTGKQVVDLSKTSVGNTGLNFGAIFVK
jgi:hypothetical protein